MTIKEYQEKKDKIEAFINSKEYRPMMQKDMVVLLTVPKEQQGALTRILAELVSEGKIIQTKKGKYQSTEGLNLVSGVFSKTQKGYGFVICQRDDKAEKKDIYIPIDATKTAMNKDLVLAKIVEDAKPNPIGEIVSILKRHKTHFVGTFEEGLEGPGVIPDDRRLGGVVLIPWKDAMEAIEGQKVKVVIDSYGDKGIEEARIVQILGNNAEIGMDVLSMVIEHDIPYEFPDGVIAQAAAVPHMVSEKDIEGRRDFRSLPTVTIDGEDTKDIDDAVSLERLDCGGLRLYVHIADVSYYVPFGTPLWKEAQKRATSVYLADRVIPMLPEALSNGICSLNPQVDRLALTCIIDFDANNNIKGHEICKTVINSNHAISYDVLDDILQDETSPNRAVFGDFIDMLEGMRGLADALSKERIVKGSLDFEFPECKLVVGADGKVIDVLRKERSVATSIIEEFMICANEAVSTEYFWLDLPFVYRVHEKPAPDKLEALVASLGFLGMSLKKGGKGSVKNLQQIIKKSKTLPQGAAVSKLVLRSLKQARYYPQALGHFGLALEYYSHFTSPIRRFPDLLIHHIISANIEGRLFEGHIELLREGLGDVCQHASENERRADECAKEVEKLKKVEFMKDKVGEVYEGVISHANPNGFYVELENTIEGVVTVSDLKDDYYEFDPHRYSFVGRRRGRSFNLGDKVTIKVADANIDMRRIEFEIVEG
ncbi:MAG: ribonuclease R [Defluviitaleaceae bacterium]|nr:ribonuclease R [Defluviitaleaceae bacterium]